MKNTLVIIMCFVCVMFYSCNHGVEKVSSHETYIGYLTVDGDTIYFDEVEWITHENKERIKELGLSSQRDMPNGYYIYNPAGDIVAYEVDVKTVYNFIDWHTDFVNEGDDRNYSTTSYEEFIRYLDSYTNKAIKVPFWLEIKEESVISITEQFVN